MHAQSVISIIIFIVLLAGGYYFMTNDTSVPETAPAHNAVSVPTGESPVMVIETAKGNITIALRPDAAPKTVANFLSLTDKKFYDGLSFHRVEPGFVVQGGDPNGDGTGGSSAAIPLEIKCADGTMTEGSTTKCVPLLKHTDGAVAMARTNDPNSATSQFYITLGAQHFLDGNYAVFGYVTDGMDVARSIQKGDRMEKVYRK